MSQSQITKLVPKLKFIIKNEPRGFRNPEGPLGRLKKLRKTVTALFKHERIELNANRGREARGYAERLINEAIKNGDAHQPTMELADFWLEEKQLIHKLFKVLVPRYRDYNTSYTDCFQAPKIYPGLHHQRCVLELRGHPFPPILVDKIPKHNQLHNILLEEARREFELKKKLLRQEDLENKSGDSTRATETVLKTSSESKIISDRIPDTLNTTTKDNDIIIKVEKMNLKDNNTS